MAISKAFTTVTPFSRLVAYMLILFLPFIGFFLGVSYQKSVTPYYPPAQYDPSILSHPAKPLLLLPSNPIEISPMPMSSSSGISPKKLPRCTMDAKQCPDGSWVGRTGTNCAFVCKKE